MVGAPGRLRSMCRAWSAGRSSRVAPRIGRPVAAVSAQVLVGLCGRLHSGGCASPAWERDMTALGRSFGKGAAVDRDCRQVADGGPCSVLSDGFSVSSTVFSVEWRDRASGLRSGSAVGFCSPGGEPLAPLRCPPGWPSRVGRVELVRWSGPPGRPAGSVAGSVARSVGWVGLGWPIWGGLLGLSGPPSPRGCSGLSPAPEMCRSLRWVFGRLHHVVGCPVATVDGQESSRGRSSAL